MIARPLTYGCTTLNKAIQELYAAGQIDYALEPVLLTDAGSRPLGRIQDGDTVVFCCRRGEREVQLTEAFTQPDPQHFQHRPLTGLRFVILTRYHEKFNHLPIAFAPAEIHATLTEVISQAGLRQLHTAESEKFAHVTFFFNGGNNQPFPGEEDVRVPSPKGIPPEANPELSLAQVVAQVLPGIEKGYDFILVNFANGDVIGHTAHSAAKIECAERVDYRLGQVVDAALAHDYLTFITADHGNLEEMVCADGTPHVAHTTNRVPFIVLEPRSLERMPVNDGRLADVAPTVLAALGLQPPAQMDGNNLIPDHSWGGRRKVLLVVLDGWGLGKEDDGNPIHRARTPIWDTLLQCSSRSSLEASGEAVGLQAGKAGNSEAGHLNLGAGRVVLQDDARLDLAMKDGSFFHNDVLCRTLAEVKPRGGNLHLIGLLTEKSSHGSIEYPLALLRMAREYGLEQAYLHLILDGRSTPPGSAPALLAVLESRMAEIGLGQVVTAVGRGIALDRDGNYAKTQQAYDALVSGRGLQVALNEEAQ